jgi:lysyl-tRNA synthetase class 2
VIDPGALASVADENDQIRARLDKRRRLEEEGVAVYPNAYAVTHTTAEAAGTFRDGEAGETCAVAGRVVSRRKMGRAMFMHVQDRAGKLQLYFKQDTLGASAYERLDLVDLGDFLGASGPIFKTKTGEISLAVHSWEFLGKAMRPLPEKWHGLADKEIRFRQRYLDLVVNDDARRIFRARTRMIAAMRRVLDSRDFLEVETPVLQPIYGGASARPFRTEHNALGVTLYLRIANELYLKRCLVAGLERVYEIAKDFRNEGMDRTHQPEFTQLEAYQAYGNYRDGMELTETLVAAAAEAANGSLAAAWRGQTIDLAPPWKRVSYFEALQEATGRDLSALDEALVRDVCRAHGVELEGDPSAAKMVDELFSRLVQPHLVQPTFVIDHARAMSPLAKQKPGAPHLVERFEPVIAGMEVGNGFSELNDPIEQRRRFEEQLSLAARDDDTMVLDEPFLRALEHGMPPASGIGLGIDRLAMVLTGADQIREVMLFPQMRPERDGGEEGEGPVPADGDATP